MVAYVDRFDLCLPTILANEGGFANNPADPGGATMKGVTLATYRAHFGAEKTVADLKAISNDELGVIYRYGYWADAHCYMLPVGADLTVFDMAVMSGPKEATVLLQRALKVHADGLWGPATFKASRSMAPIVLVANLAEQRLAYYRAIVTARPAEAIFLKGWSNRVESVHKAANGLIQT